MEGWSNLTSSSLNEDGVEISFFMLFDGWIRKESSVQVGIVVVSGREMNRMIKIKVDVKFRVILGISKESK